MGFYAFLKGLCLNPRGVGAVLPSSEYLAHGIAAQIDIHAKGCVLELGPGTGVITQAILAAGILPSQLIALELSPHFATDLQKRFGNITVIQGSAVDLPTLMQDKSIHTIVSSLPLRSLPKTDRQKILSSIHTVLGKNGRFIQFTYSLFGNGRAYFPNNAELIKKFTIWKNVPPAQVQVFRMR